MDEGETQALEAEVGFGPTFMRDMVRAEIEHATVQTPLQKLADNTWVLLTALVLLIATPVAIYRWSSSLTDDEKFERGVALMDEAPGSNWLAARDQFFLPLVESDAETWTPKVQPYLDDVEAYELERELLKRRRRNATPQDEFERLLLGIRAAWEAGDLRGAERDLHAAKVVAAVDQERSRFAPLIDRWLQQLTEELPDDKQLSEFLASQQAVIAKEREQRPAVAEQLRAALMILYRDDPAALEKLTQPTSKQSPAEVKAD
jgi:serine/threonine-protein kinase